MDDPLDEVEYLLAFEKAFLALQEADIGDWVSRWPVASQREAIAISLIEAAFEHTSFDFEWLRTLRSDERIPASAWMSKEIFRHAYAVQASKGQQPHWKDYAQCGFTAEELALRFENDRCFLGEEIAGKYTLVRRLGSGGLGTVYEAENREAGDLVAIKVPLKAVNPEPLVERLRSEARVLNSIGGPGVPQFVELLESDSGPMLVMERIRGRTLESQIRSLAFSTGEGLKVSARVATVVDLLHRQGFVHGDIKAENILMDDAGHVTLTDFNVSRTDDPITAIEGFPGGTLPFMSPEAIVGVAADVDLKQDVYALGALLYQLTHGKPLMFAAKKEEAVVKAILLGGKHDPHFRDDIPESVRVVCRIAISRHTAERFETAAEFGSACDAAMSAIDSGNTIPILFPISRNIKSWRLGAVMGTIAVRQRRITTTLASQPEPTSDTEARQVLHEIIPYAVGVATSMDEAICLANVLGLEISEWSGNEIYQRTLYRQRRLSVDDYQLFASIVPAAEKWCQASLDTLHTSLTSNDPICAAFFLAATQSRFAPYSKDAAARWPTVAEALAVPNATIEPFSAACAAYDPASEWGRILQSLDYRMIRWLRWKIEPESEREGDRQQR